MTEPAVDPIRDILRHLEGRIPGNLTSTEVENIRGGALKLLRAASKLRAVRLVNSDEPDPIFRPFRRSE